MANDARALGVGLYGINGHQVLEELTRTDGARLVAVCGVPVERLPEPLRRTRVHATLDALLDDPEVELVSLCSPRRDGQAADALKALDRGRHVYAEKPCALVEADLDALMARAEKTGRAFREMGGTVSENPWYSLRALVATGALGTVVQVHVQKSYPWHEGRNPDDGLEGGLFPWVGVHAFRMAEQIGGVPVREVTAALTTPLGAPAGNGLVMAGACLARLENGGVASLTANYLNPRGFPRWGNETVRIFGTLGMAEVVDGGMRSRWVVGTEDRGEIPAVPEEASYFQRFVDSIRGGAPMGLPLAVELHATRMSLRAREMVR